MAPPDGVFPGPRTRLVLEGRGVRNDDFPASQEWADDVERVLDFLAEQGQFERFLPRLRANERYPALAEARYAYYLDQAGFEITGWEPPSCTGNPGDLEIQFSDLEKIFVEVKQPTWGGELSEAEKITGRWHQPKWRNAEVRSVDPFVEVSYSIDQALKKFDPSRVNIVAIADDLFVSPLDEPRSFLSGRLEAKMSETAYRSISGLFFLKVQSSGCSIEYRFGIIRGYGRQIPAPALEHLSKLDTW